MKVVQMSAVRGTGSVAATEPYTVLLASSGASGFFSAEAAHSKGPEVF